MKKDTGEEQKRWHRFSRLKIERGSFKRRARKMESVTLKHAHKFLIRRWTNVRDVGRHAMGWLVLVGLLIGMAFLQMVWFAESYTTLAPAEGGTYAEGVVGKLDTINPLFATTPAETSATKLIFSSLLSYDKDNQLRTDVADSWKISEDGKTYDVTLRQDVYWQDGTLLTAKDVLFTTGLIQNPSVKALQYGNLAGVKTEKVSDFEVKFTLPTVYAPFADSLTFGILPEHLLKDIRPSELRENEFGRRPVGTGPFAFKQIQLIDPDKDRIVVHMEANRKYYTGVVNLNRFQLRTYEDNASLKKALLSSEVNAALGLGSDQVGELTKLGDFTAETGTISNGMFAIFNNDQPIFKDVQVRQALLFATDRQKIIEKISGRGKVLHGPLPSSFVPGEAAAQAVFDIKQAASKLDAAGWKLNGLERQKDGQKLEIVVVASDSGDYKLVLDEIAAQWKTLGIGVKIQLADPDTIATDYLQSRSYDVLVYELGIGADPDVYPYWHSSQANPKGLNFANYRSSLTDDVLSGARGKLDRGLRVAKYKIFYEQWLKDTPAVALYQPLLSYTTTKESTSLEPSVSVVDASTRYRDVRRWAVSQNTVMTTR